MRPVILDTRILLARRYGFIIPEPSFFRTPWLKKLRKVFGGKKKIFVGKK